MVRPLAGISVFESARSVSIKSDGHGEGAFSLASFLEDDVNLVSHNLHTFAIAQRLRMDIPAFNSHSVLLPQVCSHPCEHERESLTYR